MTKTTCSTCKGSKKMEHPTATVIRRKLNGQIIQIPKIVMCITCGGGEW